MLLAVIECALEGVLENHLLILDLERDAESILIRTRQASDSGNKPLSAWDFGLREINGGDELVGGPEYRDETIG